MICATWASCWPRPLPGNATGSAGAPSIAASISRADLIDSPSTPLAALTSFTPLSNVRMFCTAATRAVDAVPSPNVVRPNDPPPMLMPCRRRARQEQ